MQLSYKLVLAAIALAASTMASAQWYGGAGAGVAVTHFSGDYAANSAAISEETTPQTFGYKFLLGYELSPTWSVEGAFANLGKATYSYRALNATATADVVQSAITLAMKGNLPVPNTNTNLFGKVGVSYNHTALTANSSITTLNNQMGWPATYTADAQSAVIGVGAEYAVNKFAKIRFEFEDFGSFGNNTTGKTSPSLASISWVTKF
jgi:hypothetical protein